MEPHRVERPVSVELHQLDVSVGAQWRLPGEQCLVGVVLAAAPGGPLQGRQCRFQECWTHHVLRSRRQPAQNRRRPVVCRGQHEYIGELGLAVLDALCR